ncbi:MAG: hypothetical protein IJZ93_02520 [Clostridia bacterium]|nr:hypothetical protein [Clostridia bacterium]
MNIEKDEIRRLPLVMANMSSEIIYLNLKAKRVFPKLDVKKSIYEKIDEDIFRKNTMYREKLDIVDSKDDVYFKAIMKVFSKRYAKIAEFLFLNNEYFKNEENISKIKRMFSLSDENMSKAKRGVDLCKLLSDIYKKLCLKKQFCYKSVNIEEKQIACPININFVEMISINIFFIFSEMDFRSPIYITTEALIGKTKISFSTQSMLASGPNDIIDAPTLNLRMEFLKYICEKENVKLSVTHLLGRTVIDFVISHSKQVDTTLHSNVFDNIQIGRVERYIKAISLE